MQLDGICRCLFRLGQKVGLGDVVVGGYHSRWVPFHPSTPGEAQGLQSSQMQGDK